MIKNTETNEIEGNRLKTFNLHLFSLSICVTQAVFSFKGTLHLVGNHRTMTVLEGPHALKVK
jgi:hypothetical protein